MRHTQARKRGFQIKLLVATLERTSRESAHEQEAKNKLGHVSSCERCGKYPRLRTQHSHRNEAIQPQTSPTSFSGHNGLFLLLPAIGPVQIDWCIVPEQQSLEENNTAKSMAILYRITMENCSYQHHHTPMHVI